MTEHGKIDIAPEILDAAAAWHVRLNAGNVTDHDIEQHMEWLLAGPAHTDAFEQVAATMRDADDFEQAARAAFAEDLGQPSKADKPSSIFGGILEDWTWPQWSVAAAVAATLLFTVFGPGSGLFQAPATTQIYAAAGQAIESVKLSDGSTVSLFGGSELAVTMNDHERLLTLTKGRAFFDVTKNASRPFIVSAGNRQVTVVGTRFEVILSEGFERVAVNEGTVSVDAIQDTNLQPLLIEAGTIATYRVGNISPDIAKISAAAIGTWTEGVLSFDNQPLAKVVASIQQIFPEKILQLGDERLHDMTFSGTLVVSKPETMMRQLSMFLNLKLVVVGDEILLLP